MKTEHSETLRSWRPPSGELRIRTIDMHTGGEPLRIIIDGLPEIKGNTILEKRKFFKEHLDYLRTGLMFEPRGHADMYGAVITEPVTEDGDFGVFFMHNEGYSTMCGHAVIALTRLVLESGMAGDRSNKPFLLIDAPPGRVVASATMDGDTIIRTSFINVPSFVLLKDEKLEVEGVGSVRFDVAFGGAFYAICDAGQLGLSLEAHEFSRLIDFGRRIKNKIMAVHSIQHPFEEDLGFLYGTIFTGPPLDKSNHSRNVCIFAEGELDRSSTGSGVSARAALH